MDKFEYELKVEQIEKLIRRNDFSTAKKISDTMDWRREKDFRLLARVAELYVQAGDYNQALKLLSFAYDNAPIGRLIIGRMTEVAIIAGRLDAAEEYCQEFRSVLPKDPDYYLYKFQIAEGRGGDNLAEMISCLEQYCRTELDEEWMCRLAYLYDAAGRKDDCVSTCDRIILFFCFGEYVDLAMELKQKYEPLNPYQLRRKEQKAQYEEDFKRYLEQHESDRQQETTRRQDKQQVKEDQLMEKTASQIGQQVAEIVEKEKLEKERESIAMLAEPEVLFTPSIDIEEEMLRAKQEQTAQSEIEEEIPEQIVTEQDTPALVDEEPLETEETEAEQAETEEEESLSEESGLSEPEKPEAGEDLEKLEEELIFGKIEETGSDESEELSEIQEQAFTEDVQAKEEPEASEEVGETSEEEEPVEAEEASEEEISEETEKSEEEKSEEEESLFGALKKALAEYIQTEESIEEGEKEEEELEEEMPEESEEESEEEMPEESEEESEEEELEESEEESEEEELEESEEEFEEKELKESEEASEEEESEETEEEESEEDYEELEEEEFEDDEEDFDEEDEYEEEEEEGRFADEVDEAELLIPNGSFAVVSDDIAEGSQFVVELLKRISEEEHGLHLARATAEYLNKAKFNLIEQQADDGMLLAVKAGDLNDAALDKLYAWMKKDGENKLILMDSKDKLEEIEKRRPKLMKRMSGTYSYVERSSEEWLRLMRLYAKENGGVLHESAQELMMEYLEDKEERQELVMLLDLKEAVQDALHQAARPTFGNLLAGLLARRYDEDGLLILKEKHFL